MFGLPSSLDTLVRGAVLACIALAWVIVLVRIFGLRTFSKMTAFDFVVTLAVASLLASGAAATSWSQFVQALVAITVLLAAQVGLAQARQTSRQVRDGIGNTPLLLLRDGEFLDAALESSRVTREDVLAKIRQANVRSVAEVGAVVLETTGDISVLSGGAIDPALVEGIRAT